MQQYRNWGLMIVGIHLTPVVWLALLIAIFWGASSYLFTPIYEANTILSLDSSLAKILKGLKTSIPSTESGDFIRVEYFATNTLQTISYPEIAAEVVNKLNITDTKGEKIAPSDLHSKSAWKLALTPHKKGVAVEWVADTQQFSVTGYAPDIDGAAALADSYAIAFLNYNRNQFSSLFDSIMNRLQDNKTKLEKDLAQINATVQGMRREYDAYVVDNTQEQLAQNIQTLEREISDLGYAEQIYQTRYDHLTGKIKELEELKTVAKKIQKNPEVTSLLATIRSLSINLAEISNSKTPDHPAYQTVEKQLKAAQELLNKETETSLAEISKEMASSTYNQLVSELVSLIGNHLINESKVKYDEGLIAFYKERQDKLTGISQDLNYLGKQRDTLFTTLNNVLSDIYLLENVKNNNLPILRIVSSTDPQVVTKDSQRVFPKRKRLVILSFIGTFFILGFSIFFSEIITDKLYAAWQLAGRKNSRLAEVPFLPAASNACDNTAEICKHIHEICVAARAKPVVRVAALQPRAGQEAVAASLASYSRRFENTVVICDCDTTSGQLTKCLGLADRPGIKDILRGDAEITDDMIHTHPELRFSVIPVGTGSVQVRGLEEMERFENLLNKLRDKNIKTVILDAPITKDELLLTEAYADAHCVLVLKSGSAAIEPIDAMRDPEPEQRGATSRVDDIVLTALPYAADILTVTGIYHFAIHFATTPLRLFKTFPRSRHAR